MSIDPFRQCDEMHRGGATKPKKDKKKRNQQVNKTVLHCCDFFVVFCAWRLVFTIYIYMIGTAVFTNVVPCQLSYNFNV